MMLEVIRGEADAARAVVGGSGRWSATRWRARGSAWDTKRALLGGRRRPRTEGLAQRSNHGGVRCCDNVVVAVVASKRRVG